MKECLLSFGLKEACIDSYEGYPYYSVSILFSSPPYSLCSTVWFVPKKAFVFCCGGRIFYHIALSPTLLFPFFVKRIKRYGDVLIMHAFHKKVSIKVTKIKLTYAIFPHSTDMHQY